MPKIGNPTPSHEIPCDRCNGKKIVAKTWTEKIKTDNGITILQHSQLICTNKECQSKFEKVLQDEIEKREKLKQIKLENTAKRMAAKAN